MQWKQSFFIALSQLWTRSYWIHAYANLLFSLDSGFCLLYSGHGLAGKIQDWSLQVHLGCDPFLATIFTSTFQSSSLGRHEKYYWFILMPSHNFFSWVSDFRCMQLWYKSNIITNLPPVVGVLHLHAQIQEITITPSNTRVPIPLCSCNSWCTNSEDSNFTWRFKSRTLSCLIIRFGKHCVGEHEGEKRFGEQVFRKPLVGSCEQVGANEDKAK